MLGAKEPCLELGIVRASWVESSDNYNQIHPDVTHKVNGETVTERPWGLWDYAIESSAWLKEAGMKPMTEQNSWPIPRHRTILLGLSLINIKRRMGLR